MKIGDRIKTKNVIHLLLKDQEGLIVDIKTGYYIKLDSFKDTDIVHWFSEDELEKIL